MRLEGIQSNQRDKKDGEESGCTRAPEKGGGTSRQRATQTWGEWVCDAGMAPTSGGGSAVCSEAGGKEDWLVQAG